MNDTTDLYPSRVGSEEKLLPRLDPVVYRPTPTSSPFSLTKQQVSTYERDGVLILPDYFNELVPALRKETENLKNSLQDAEEMYTEPDSDELRTLFKPFAFSELIDAISRDPRIVEPVRQLLGSDVYIMQSRINIKPALKGQAFPWHSDFETWHVEDGMPRMRALTAWIMLDENHPYNGPLYVLKGSHKRYISCAGKTADDNYKRSLKRQSLGVPQPQTLKPLMADHSLSGIYGKAGTLVFHECNLLHGSPDNISGDPRSILMFVYNSVDNRPVRPFGGVKPRPHYLNNRDTLPLRPLHSPVRL